MQRLQELEVEMLAAPDQQLSLTDPDARSMATSGRGTGMVGYNVQSAVDAKHHLIVVHEVTNIGHDRDQLSSMAKQARTAMGSRATVMQQKTGQPVKFELTDQTREAIEAWIAKTQLASGQFLFPSRMTRSPHISTRQYARIVKSWVARIGLDPDD